MCMRGGDLSSINPSEAREKSDAIRAWIKEAGRMDHLNVGEGGWRTGGTPLGRGLRRLGGWTTSSPLS